MRPEEVDTFWGHIEDYIQKSSLRSYYGCKAEHIYNDIVIEDSLLWVILEGTEVVGAIITTVHLYPIGCSYIEGIGRKGWKKYFPDYDTDSIVFTKELKSRKH